jgi:hypothetical protein
VRNLVFTLAGAWYSLKPRFIQKSWSKLWPTQHDYQDEKGGKCDWGNNDLLTVAEPVNTVRLCTNLTDIEVKEWDTRQNENDCMQMLRGNENAEKVLQGNEDKHGVG